MDRVLPFLRYPGGKSKALKKIKAHFPISFREYREPFCGSAAIFLSIDPSIPRWINDFNPHLIHLYEALKSRPRQFIEMCREIAPAAEFEPLVTTVRGGKWPKRLYDLFHSLLHDEEADPALRYLFLNRCGWNGRVILESSRRSRSGFTNPEGWSNSMLTRLEQAAERLAHATITCSSYEHLFEAPGDDVLIVADPPYVMETNLSPSSKLYEFGFSLGDHRRLRDCVLRCRHKVLMTYDDHPLVRELYRELFVHEASWVYSGRADRKIGRELIITNYPRQQPIL